MSSTKFEVRRNNGRQPGDEEPYEGYWAYLSFEYWDMIDNGGYGGLGEAKGPYPTRGWGQSELEAIALLCALLTEQYAISTWENEKAYRALIGGE